MSLNLLQTNRRFAEAPPVDETSNTAQAGVEPLLGDAWQHSSLCQEYDCLRVMMGERPA